MSIKAKPTATQLSVLLYEYGVRHVVLSPGSRNAPIIIALAASGRYILHYVVDERVAAFVALGIAVSTGQAVAMVCTSGSAILDYAPAIAEAYYSSIPLIAISADRPYYDIDQNKPQTLRQHGILDNIVRKSVDIRDGEKPDYSNRLLNEALQAAVGLMPGPVHINMQFEMPLTPIGETDPVVAYKSQVVRARELPVFKLEAALKYLIYIGGLPPGEDVEKCRRLLNTLPCNVAVVAEAQSNLSSCSTVTAADFDNVIEYIEKPDIVVMAGSSPVSAKIGSWIGESALTSIHIDPMSRCYNGMTIAANLSDFLESIAFDNEAQPSVYHIDAAHAKPSRVSRLIEKLSGQDIMLHLSNGMTVREAQKVKILRPTDVWSNRGVSGIDGATSTAIGSALVSEKPVVLVTGDMSAAYDVGALAVEGVGGNFTMVVVNNHGGEIFRRVATTRDLPERELYFTAMPKFPLAKLADAYGFDYSLITTPEEFEPAKGDKPKIVELIIQ